MPIRQVDLDPVSPQAGCAERQSALTFCSGMGNVSRLTGWSSFFHLRGSEDHRRNSNGHGVHFLPIRCSPICSCSLLADVDVLGHALIAPVALQQGWPLSALCVGSCSSLVHAGQRAPQILPSTCRSFLHVNVQAIVGDYVWVPALGKFAWDSGSPCFRNMAGARRPRLLRHHEQPRRLETPPAALPP